MNVFCRCWFLLAVFFSSQMFSEEERILFLSHPRSGTRWSLFCICSLTDRNLDFRLGYSNLRLVSGFTDRPNGTVFAAHSIYSFGEIDRSNDKLILIVRNYKEAMLSCNGTPGGILQTIAIEAKSLENIHELDELLSSKLGGYFVNIYTYDLWNPSNRLLYYYEDLVSDPFRVLGEIMDFLEIDPNGEIPFQFLENFEENRNQFLDRAFSGGKDQIINKDLKLYSKLRLDFAKEKEIDEKLKECFPYLYKTYLKRYEIEDNAL